VTLIIIVRYGGGTYTARCDGARASCTIGAREAAKRVLAKAVRALPAVCGEKAALQRLALAGLRRVGQELAGSRQSVWATLVPDDDTVSPCLRSPAANPKEAAQ
jgi:hypothetical protein